MKRKVTIVVLAVLLVAALVQVGFAANYGGNRGENPRFGGEGICRGYCADLSPAEREQVRTICEEQREKMEALREEFRSGRDALRKECLEQMPEAAREQLKEKMAEREARHQGKPWGRHCYRGHGFGG
ncbi:MAG TPA: periplasmic heavy metal sensor [Firmicutes bacterium]|nr:periplasmic heavy metal sensor [Bacillota bacterium]